MEDAQERHTDAEPSASVTLADIPDEPKRRCDTCRWWDMHSLAMKAGDCRVPGNHRYSRVPLETRRPDGSIYRSYAMLDSFGAETTPPGYVCGAWDDGYREARLAAARERSEHLSPLAPASQSSGEPSSLPLDTSRKK